MKIMKLKISDLYPIATILDTTKLKIFDFLGEYESLEDVVKTDDIAILNNDYYLSHSNDKYISPLVEKLFNDGKTPEQISELVAQICYSRFGTKWVKIYNALLTEYNPLENYSMEEIRTPDLEDSDTENTKSKITTTRNTTATNQYKGFNANNPVTISKTDGEETSTTGGASDDNETSRTSTHTGTETLTRAGNIGVTTSQQMLESEFKVRQYDFYKELFNDIDSVMCLMIY